MQSFRAEHIAASYPRAGRIVRVLDDASFELEAGGVYDLTGPSGAGKSTLLRVCALMLACDGGELYLDDAPSSSFEPAAWRRRVCLVPQQPALVPGTVRDNLLLPWTLRVNAGSEPPSDAALSQLLERAGLADVELARSAAQLSGGQLARIALLRAFATKPEVLLLDEVDAALDDESARAVGRLTKELVDERMACLRIRHRASDGSARGAFELRDGALAYATNVRTSSALRAAGEGTRS